MHNNIMAAGLGDRPPMLVTGRYAQWQSCFIRYVDTKPNGETLRKRILQGPYKLSNIITLAQPATDESPVVPERTIPETFTNITLKYKAHYDAEKEAIYLLLIGIGDEIYSTVNACKTAQDMWIAIERLQQGESLNKQDVKTSLFLEFGRFTSRDGESIESYYSRFYKMMNEMVRNQLEVATMQCEKEVNEIRAKKIAKNANPLSLELEDSDCCWAKETVGSQVVQQTRIQCFNSEQADWLEDTDEEIDEQELEAHYNFMAEIQEVLHAESGYDVEPLEKIQYDAEYNVFANERQHSEQPESINDTHVVEKDDKCDDEHVMLANLKLNTDENKKIQKKLKKANTSLSHELQECKSALEECKSSLEKSNRTRDRYLGALHDKEVELEKYKIFKDRTIEKYTLERKLNETLGLLAQKEHDIKEGLKIKAYEVYVVKEKNDELVKQNKIKL
ncbi:hypothetical protein Tco_0380900 [Tanacetum coccineum]